MSYDEETLVAILKDYARGWSCHDASAILSLVSDDVRFEDVPLDLVGNGKADFEQLLALAFSVVPDIRMEIVRYRVGQDFVAFFWMQTGTASHTEDSRVGDYAIEGDDLIQKRYSVLTTTIMEFDSSGKISSIVDNWDRSALQD